MGFRPIRKRLEREVSVALKRGSGGGIECGATGDAAFGDRFPESAQAVTGWRKRHWKREFILVIVRYDKCRVQAHGG